MKKLILTFLLFSTISFLPLGCCFDSCCGETFSNPGKLNIYQMELDFVKSLGEPIRSNEFVEFTEARFRLNVVDFEFISQATKPEHYGLGFAYACSPPEPTPEYFTCYKITSNEQVEFNNSSVAAGEDLSQYFEYQGYSYDGLFYLPYYGESFVLTSSPTVTIDQSFEFELVMDDGEVFTLTIPNVRINPV